MTKKMGLTSYQNLWDWKKLKEKDLEEYNIYKTYNKYLHFKNSREVRKHKKKEFAKINIAQDKYF